MEARNPTTYYWSRMAKKPKSKTKPSARLQKLKKERSAIVAARVKEFDESKRRGVSGRGYTRADLEALRDGRR